MTVRSSNRAVVWAVAIAMLAVPAQAMATHNSIGLDLEITRADEVDADGSIDPDLENDSRLWNFSQRFHHGDLEGTPAPDRMGPEDQSGSHYDSDVCRSYSDFEDVSGSQDDHYEAALPGDHDTGGIEETKDACWVGFLDDQIEYTFVGNLAGGNFLPIVFGAENPPWPGDSVGPVDTHCVTCLPASEEDEDPLYFLNPEADDSSCDQPDTSDACMTKSHSAYWPGFDKMVAIDSDYVEAALANEDDTPAPTSVGDAGGTSQGSGTISLPQLFTYKTFLFGYPHPNNEDPSSFTAEQLDQPAWGVPANACGDRTPECTLLDPTDLKEYDTNTGETDAIQESDRGRLCSFSPQYGTINPAGADVGPCGIYGTHIETFYEDIQAGGFGTDTVSTYQATLPGYKEGVVALTNPTSQAPADWPFRFGTENTTGVDEQGYGENVGDALLRIVAVNPVVADSDDPASCTRPNFVADGTKIKHSKDWNAQDVADEFDDISLSEAQDIGELDAPGIYGTFRADAIDNDAYSHSLRGFQHSLQSGEGVPGYEGYRETFGDVLGTADSLAGDATSTAQDLADQAVDQLPDQTPGQDAADDAVDQTDDVVNRVQVEQGDDREPINEPADEPGDSVFESFSDDPDVTEGVTCQGASLEFVEDPEPIPGRLHHNATLSRQAIALEDPTILDDQNLPANKSNTSEGAWHTEGYSFGGPLVAYFDKGGGDGFDGCDPADGQPDPSLDDCAWIPVWDAYNTACTETVEGDSTPCSEVLATNGFDVGPSEDYDVPSEDEPPRGVGLVATLELTGTTLLANQPSPDAPMETVDNLQVINQDPTQKTCLVITSQGFDEYLPQHVDGMDDFTEAQAEALCSEDADEVMTISDGFETQDGPNDQGFTSSLVWAPLVPAPDAVRDAADIGDQRLCVSAVFSTQESVLASENTGEDETPGTSGTGSTVSLGADHTETYYTDCDVISQEYQEDGPASAETGYEGAYYSDVGFPVDAHAGSD